jgi:ABC-2 type transport system ATP-binding protein
MEPPMLDITDVTISFADYHALYELTLPIKTGQIFGLLGPNGAGKTTLIRAIMGLQPVHKGHIRLFDGLLPGSQASRNLIGYMPQLYAVYDQLTVRENLRFFAELYSLPKHELNNRVNELLTMTELEAKADAIVHTLSGGMKRRTMMATALAHKPKLLIMDEPTAGVDPILRIKFWQWFRALRDQGTSILVTTHHINEAEHCDDIGFLRAGKLIGRGSPEQLLQQYKKKNLEDVYIELAHSMEVTQ